MSHKLSKEVIELMREAGVDEAAIALMGQGHVGEEPSGDPDEVLGIADGTRAGNKIFYGNFPWPQVLEPFLFNALNGNPEPLPESLWKQFRDDVQFNARDYAPWVALMALSQQYYEVELPAIERELAAAAGAGAAAGGGAGEGGELGGDAPYEALGTILGLGGRAARELAYSDPASFINLLVEEATGDGETSSLLRNFLISQAPRLYALAGLDELLGNQPNVGGLERTQDIFEQFVTPGSDFIGGRESVVKSLTELAGQPSKQPGAAASTPRDFFDEAFFLIQDTLAPTMTPTAAATLFNSERRQLERALFTTATVQGKFTGSPFEWLQSRGYF